MNLVNEDLQRFLGLYGRSGTYTKNEDNYTNILKNSLKVCKINNAVDIHNLINSIKFGIEIYSECNYFFRS